MNNDFIKFEVFENKFFLRKEISIVSEFENFIL